MARYLVIAFKVELYAVFAQEQTKSCVIKLFSEHKDKIYFNKSNVYGLIF